VEGLRIGQLLDRSVDLAVDTSGFHFFDKDNGQAIGHPDTTGDGAAVRPPRQNPAQDVADRPRLVAWPTTS